MDAFVSQLHRLQLLAEQQFRRLVNADCQIQQSFLFRDGKFVGVRYLAGDYRIEWLFGEDKPGLFRGDEKLAALVIAPSENRHAA